MPAYVIALIQRIQEPEAYKQYVGQVEATLRPFGGRFLARKVEPELLEGPHGPSRAAILEFPDVERARAWHSSDVYGPVAEQRRGASQGMLILLPGYEAPRADP